MNIFAILGFIAILLAGLWATVQLVKIVSDLSFEFSRPSIALFGSSDELSIIDSGKIAYSGEPIEINWTLGQDAQDNAGAIISLSYKCQEGLYIKTLTGDTKEEYKVLPCNAPYNMPATATNLSIIPILIDQDTSNLKYALTYTPGAEDADSAESKQTTQGSIQIATRDSDSSSDTDETSKKVDNQDVANNTTTPKSNNSTTSTKPSTYTKIIRTVVPIRTSDPAGLPDLTVSVTNVSVDNSTGVSTLRLEVSNQGTKMVSDWTLSAILPTEPAYTYASAPQQALYAGEKAEMLLTFDKTKSGIQDIKITVDPDNKIIESLETNNSAELKMVN
jgi:hypothetical protein